MKRFFSLVFAALLPIVGIAHAQQSQWLWWGATNPIPVTATNPLPVTVSGGLSVMKTDASNAVLPDALNNLGLGTTSTPQFGAIGLGTPATSLGLNLNFSTAVPSSPIVYAHGNIFGSTIGSGVQSAYTFNVDNDSIDASSATGAYGFYSSLGVGQATAKGNRTGGFFGVTQKSPTGNTAGSGSFYTALGSMGVADANDNGIVGVPSGAMFGNNAQTRITTNSTFYNGMSSAEFDVAAEGASSLQYKTGLSIVQLLSDLNQGVLQDTALLIANQGSGTAPGWKCGICYGGPVGWWPITSTGTMMGTQSALAGGPAYAAAHGIDFSAVTFSSDFLKSTGFLVDPSGNTTTPNVTVGAGTISGASIRATGHANTGLWFVSGTSAALTTNGVQTLEVSNTGGIRVYGGAPSTGLTVSAATFGGSVTNGGVYAGRGSTNDVTLQNSGGTIVAAIPTGSTNLNVPGAITDNGTAPTGTAGSGYARATSPVFVTPTLGAASATSVTGLSAPVNGSDATNKTYVDAIASGIVTHASAQAATTANLTPVTLSGTGVGKTITNVRGRWV
jgi:hypothetical protein